MSSLALATRIFSSHSSATMKMVAFWLWGYNDENEKNDDEIYDDDDEYNDDVDDNICPSHRRAIVRGLRGI